MLQNDMQSLHVSTRCAMARAKSEWPSVAERWQKRHTLVQESHTIDSISRKVSKSLDIVPRNGGLVVVVVVEWFEKHVAKIPPL